VLSHTSDYGSFSVITIDGDTNIWIIGQTSATLQATDFAFSKAATRISHEGPRPEPGRRFSQGLRARVRS
jgi:hypothetical protein